MVLSTQWLSTLGLISWDFKELEMEFMYQGMKVWLQGIKSTSSVIQDGEQFLKQSDQKGLFLQIVSQLFPLEVQPLLEEFAIVFEEPKCFPPCRGHEH